MNPSWYSDLIFGWVFEAMDLREGRYTSTCTESNWHTEGLVCSVRFNMRDGTTETVSRMYK